MRFLVITLLFFISSISFSQKDDLQKHSEKAPFWINNNHKRLTHYLTRPYDNDSLKIRAIYVCISNNIKYDLKVRHKEISSNRILKRKKGICTHYAQLFEDMCKVAGVDILSVEGYTKGSDYFPEHKFYWNNHIWNVVKFNGKWQLMDLTWGSGYTIYHAPFYKILLAKWFRIPFIYKPKFVQQQDDIYYCTNPAKLVFTHLPAVEEMQMLHHPISIEVFEKNNKEIDSTLTHSTNLYHDSTSANYALLERIKYKSEVEKNLYLAPKVESFNKRNDEFTMRAHQGAYLKLKEEHKHIDKKRYQKIYDKDNEIIKLLKVTKKHAGGFKRDSYSSYKWNSKVNNSRQSKIYKSTTGKRGIFKGVRLRSKIAKNKYYFGIIKAKTSLAYHRSRLARKPQNTVNRVIRPKKDKPSYKTTVSKLLEQLKKNQTTTQQLFQEANVIKDSLELYRIKEGQIHEKEINVLCELLHDISNRVNLNQRHAWMEKILPFIKHSDSLMKEFKAVQTKETNYRKQVMLKNRKAKYNKYKTALRLSKNNLKLIKRIKKYSYNNGNEYQLYNEELNNYMQVKQRFIEMYEDRLSDKQDFHTYKANENRYAKALVLYYSYEIVVEKVRHKYRKKKLTNEHKNTSRYAKHVLNISAKKLKTYQQEMLKLKRLIKEQEKEQKEILAKNKTK